MEKCRTCRFRGEITVAAPTVAVEGQETQEPVMQVVHLCRFNPPTSTLMPTPEGMQAVTLWPQINPDTDYCGSYFAVLRS